MNGNAADLVNDKTFRRACREAGGEFGELARSPGGHYDNGCELPDGTKLFVDRDDPMTGEEPDNYENAVLTVEYNANSLSTEISRYNVGDGPQRIDFYSPGDLGSATFSTEF